jgi:hypothetical protein
METSALDDEADDQASHFLPAAVFHSSLKRMLLAT